MAQTEADLIAPVRRYLEVLRNLNAERRRDIKALLALLHDDIAYHIPFLEAPAAWHGKAELEPFFQSMQGLFEDVRYAIHGEFVDIARQTVWIEMTSSRKVMPQGLVYENAYAMAFTLRDGLIVSLREYVNPLPARELSRRLKLG